MKKYPCPKCGAANTGNDVEVRHGLKCTECGTGYIPVVIESRPFKHKESPALYIGLGIGGAVLLVALAIAFDIVSFWIVWALVIAALLGGIYLRLARK